MCVGIALAWSELPTELIGRHALERRAFERGGEREVRFYYRDRRPRLPVWRDGRLQIVQDVMLGWTPQDKTLNFEAVLNEITAVCQAFGIKDVIGDDYGAEWPVQAFANVGLNFVKAPDKSVAYQELHKLITQSEIDILDNRTMIRELSLLERTYHKGGRVRIDHPSRGRDDHAVCLALAAQATVQMFSVEAADWGSYEGDVVGNMLDSGW